MTALCAWFKRRQVSQLVPHLPVILPKSWALSPALQCSLHAIPRLVAVKTPHLSLEFPPIWIRTPHRVGTQGDGILKKHKQATQNLTGGGGMVQSSDLAACEKHAPAEACG